MAKTSTGGYCGVVSALVRMGFFAMFVSAGGDCGD